MSLGSFVSEAPAPTQGNRRLPFFFYQTVDPTSANPGLKRHQFFSARAILKEGMALVMALLATLLISANAKISNSQRRPLPDQHSLQVFAVRCRCAVYAPLAHLVSRCLRVGGVPCECVVGRGRREMCVCAPCPAPRPGPPGESDAVPRPRRHAGGAHASPARDGPEAAFA